MGLTSSDTPSVLFLFQLSRICGILLARYRTAQRYPKICPHKLKCSVSSSLCPFSGAFWELRCSDIHQPSIPAAHTINTATPLKIIAWRGLVGVGDTCVGSSGGRSAIRGVAGDKCAASTEVKLGRGCLSTSRIPRSASVSVSSLPFVATEGILSLSVNPR